MKTVLSLLLAAVALATSGCADSHATDAHEHDVATACTYKASHGLQLNEHATRFAGVEIAEFDGTLPAGALLRTARGNFVYVENDGWLLRTAVTLDSDQQVDSGLYEGDRIVVAGTRALWLAELQAVNGGVGCADGH